MRHLCASQHTNQIYEDYNQSIDWDRNETNIGDTTKISNQEFYSQIPNEESVKTPIEMSIEIPIEIRFLLSKASTRQDHEPKNVSQQH